MATSSPLTRARYNRTKTSNAVRSMIASMLDTSRPLVGYLDQYGLPSWWPFWSDCLKQDTIEAVRAARALDRLEAIAHGYTPQLGQPAEEI